MSYTDLYTQKKTKNTVAVLLLVLVLLGSFIAVKYLLPKRKTLAQNTGISQVQITNIFPTQATIIWKTAKDDRGWLVWGSSELDLSHVSYDDRDDSGKHPYTYHSVTLKDLKPKTSYFFKITNGSEFFSQNGKDTFTFASIDNLKQSSQNKPAYGKYVVGNTPTGDAIVVIEHPQIYPLSTITKSSGEWLIPFNYSVDRTTGRLHSLKSEDVVTVHIYDESGKKTQVEARVSQLSPLKNAIAQGATVNLATPKSTTAAANSVVSLIYPKKNAVITADTPLIKGTAEAGTDVVVTLTPQKNTTKGSQSVYYTATADKDGVWKLSLPKALSPGAYEITVNSRGSTNQKALVARTFSIAKSGTQVLGESTPASSITPTASPTPTLTTTPTPTSTASASLSPTATQPTITPFTTSTPAPQLTATPGPLYADLTGVVDQSPTPPVAGISVFPMAITSVVLMVFGAALLVIF